ncbi:hypothetical protein V495_08704 [Pseudogymnoascus sp. VKM F-4514 (FW-929)]|nr:hypothetical protein V495_08704 [Pseudogymnoascus sp. VKM F-4514 (FW-929)]KFY56562.1 hypothetical protein V497_06148 [Pseudogymnoascus sp. VKM F-4516 (FW-969)]
MTKSFPLIPTAEFTWVPGSVTINDLPDELIISIARFITLDTNAAARDMPEICANNLTLLSLALCSHRFHGLVEPVLHERFHDGGGGMDEHVEKFLLRILERPDLARSLRFIQWQKILSYSLDVNLFGVEGWKVARDRIMELYESPTERDAWDENVEEVGLEAIVALLFVLAPNLEEIVLHACEPIGSGPPVLKWMSAQIRRLQLQKQVDNPAALWKLRSVNVNMWYTNGEDPSHLMQLMTIPSVEIFWVSSTLNESVLRDLLLSNNLVLGNIKELSLTCSRVSPDIFRQFLCRFPNLKRLYCDLGEPSALESYPPDLMFVPNFLEPQLEDLHISDRATLLKKGILIQRKLKSLASFTNLRTLRTSWAQLVGQTDIVGDVADALFGQDIPETSRQITDVIPTSLERLHLVGHCKSAPAVIFELLGQKHRFPRLKYLDLGWQRNFYLDKLIPEDPHFHHQFSKAESLKCLSMCREAGVEMIMWNSVHASKT